MAKKVLTPEEVQAKMEKKSAKRKLFFGTFTKALAFFLAIAMAYSLATIAFTPATAPAGTNSVQSGEQAGGASTDDGGSMFVGDESSTPSGDESSTPSGGESSTPSGGESSTPSGGQQSSQPTKADVAKALNDATKAAAAASYNWSRTGKFTKDISVGGLEYLINPIISGVVKNNDNPDDDNYSINDVVGGFLGIKNQSASITNGAGEGFDGKYLLKAMTLTENDIEDFRVNGNTYQVQIKNTTTPDANSAWAHASNDYITFAEVNESIAGAVGDQVQVQEDGSVANYKSILITAVIENGKLTNLRYSYKFDATLKIKVGITATGTGAAEINAEYKDFKY